MKPTGSGKFGASDRFPFYITVTPTNRNGHGAQREVRMAGLLRLLMLAALAGVLVSCHKQLTEPPPPAYSRLRLGFLPTDNAAANIYLDSVRVAVVDSLLWWGDHRHVSPGRHHLMVEVPGHEPPVVYDSVFTLESNANYTFAVTGRRTEFWGTLVRTPTRESRTRSGCGR